MNFRSIFSNKYQKVETAIISSKRYSFLLGIIFTASTFAIAAAFLIISQNSTFASPSTPPTPVTISLSVDQPTLDLSFTQSDIASATPKNVAMGFSLQTNNRTGATVYVSSVDENTNLKNTNISITDTINSISAQSALNTIPENQWGYRISSAASPVLYNPIPKASAPDAAFITNTISTSAAPATGEINFAAHIGAGLTPGTYTKQILFTATTNYSPRTAIFVPGPEFNQATKDLNTAQNLKKFKKSTTQPANLADAKIVSTNDSDTPIYMWKDDADESIYWWSDADAVYSNEDSSKMFMGALYCYAHCTVDIDLRGINTSKTKNMSYMFKDGDSFYNSIDFSEFDSSSAEDMSYMFAGGGDKFRTPVMRTVDFSRFDTSKVTNMSHMFEHTNLEDIDLTHFNTSSVTNMDYMFANIIYSYGGVFINLAGLDVRNVLSMEGIFKYDNRSPYNSIDVLNLSGWKNNHITDLSYFLQNHMHLFRLDMTGFNMPNVTNMKGMFKGALRGSGGHAHASIGVDLSSLDTSKVTDMSEMFTDTEIDSLNISNFNTSRVTNMSDMFRSSRKLTQLNVANFDTSIVTNMKGMFSDMWEITSLDLSSFNTSNVTDMSDMFLNDKKLTDLNLSSFNTEKVTDMSSMFRASFTDTVNGILDISSFKTPLLENTKEMFSGVKLKTIYVSTDFVTNNVTESNSMFRSATNLVGGNGTSYQNTNPSDKTYAHVDAPGNPGYFTQKP